MSSIYPVINCSRRKSSKYEESAKKSIEKLNSYIRLAFTFYVVSCKNYKTNNCRLPMKKLCRNF